MTEQDIRKILGNSLAYLANAFDVLKAQKILVRNELTTDNSFQIQCVQVIFEFSQRERPGRRMVRAIKDDQELCCYKSSDVISKFVHPELVEDHLTVLLHSTESFVSQTMTIENNIILF
jgi:hypothetical protein